MLPNLEKSEIIDRIDEKQKKGTVVVKIA